MRLYRFRADTDPIIINVKSNGIAMDLTGSTLTLEYGTKTISGTLTDAVNGQVTFTPTGGIDFQVAGQFKYKVVKVNGTIKKTLIKNVIVVDDDSVA